MTRPSQQSLIDGHGSGGFVVLPRASASAEVARLPQIANRLLLAERLEQNKRIRDALQIELRHTCEVRRMRTERPSRVPGGHRRQRLAEVAVGRKSRRVADSRDGGRADASRAVRSQPELRQVARKLRVDGRRENGQVGGESSRTVAGRACCASGWRHPGQASQTNEGERRSLMWSDFPHLDRWCGAATAECALHFARQARSVIRGRDGVACQHVVDERQAHRTRRLVADTRHTTPMASPFMSSRTAMNVLP